MRRLAIALAMALTIAAIGCKRHTRHDQSAIDLLSVVPMDDPHAASQLVRGFHSLEGSPWRWTAGQFTVNLRPPLGAAQDGARLELNLNIPDTVFQQLGAMTVSATAAGSPLAPEKYTKPGNYVYAREVPASALAGNRISIDFATDKAIPAGTIEKRELALIVTSVCLVAKH